MSRGADSGREIWRVNSFTNRPFSGNPAGVVPEADGLSETAMQAIAAELNDVSETAFISPDPDGEADIQLRFFTSTMEVDLCGHATMAALFVLAWTGVITGRDETRRVRARTPVGVLDLGMEFDGNELAWATMEQLAPEFAAAPGADHAAEVLGLPRDAIATDLNIGCCSTGIWACFVPLKDLDALAQVQIQPDLIQSLWPENEELSGVYAFAFRDSYTTQGRFFSPPKYGIFEDPVTGTASGALGGYLMSQDRIADTVELIAHQGIEMGRAGRVRVRRNPNGRMAISGQATPVFHGHLLA
ncbi:MAG: PhzF family phenazine biosynthesis protein [Gammaproteobacteria bacterium]|nr:PhzF family phenazine biosynthesis protein [Gammaproteobacteria bacterium]